MEDPTDLAPVCHLICPNCGADSDAPDKILRFFDPIPAPHANYLLMEILCDTCEHKFDVALWVIKRGFLRAAATEDGEPYEQTLGPEALATLGRYLRDVNGHREILEAYRRDRQDLEDQLVVSFKDVYIDPERYNTIPATALAAARAIRKVACAHHGHLPVGRYEIGPFICVFSVDDPEQGQPARLHLSVSRPLAPESLSTVEAAFLTGLFFTPEECPFLIATPGISLPVVHYWLDIEASMASDC